MQKTIKALEDIILACDRFKRNRPRMTVTEIVDLSSIREIAHQHLNELRGKNVKEPTDH